MNELNELYELHEINAARTLAPMTAAFSAGASVGPAIGGFLAQSYGLAPCFFYVGGAIGGVGVLNWALLPETKPPLPKVINRLNLAVCQ
jgi:MFS family permease